MTHPFHPLFGQDLEFVKRRRNWQLDRVYAYDAAGVLVSLPAEWTDVVAEDPFVVLAAGTSPLHIERLLELADLVSRMRAERSVGEVGSVNRIML